MAPITVTAVRRGPAVTVSPQLRVTTAPSGTPVSARYSVLIEGEPCATYQTPVDYQGQRDHFSNFETDAAGNCEVTVVTTGPAITTAEVLPLRHGIEPNVVNGSTVTFDVTDTTQYTLILNDDWLNPLNVFANPYDFDPPNPGDVEHFYGEGVWNTKPNGAAFGSFWGEHRLLAGEQCYVHRNAWVNGKIFAGPATAGIGPTMEGVHVFGYGVVDSTGSTSTMGPGRPAQIGNLIGGGIDGLTLIGNRHWGCTIAESYDVALRYTKMLNYYKAGPVGEKGTPDGIDVVGSSLIEYDHPFIRAADDCIAIKTSKNGFPGSFPNGAWRGNVEDIWVHDGVFHGGNGGNGFDIGYETFNNSTDGTTPLIDPTTGQQIAYIRNLAYQRNDFIRKTFDPAINYRCAVLGIHSTDNTPITNVLWEDINVDHFSDLDSLVWVGSGGWDSYTYGQRGPIDLVTLRRVNFRSGTSTEDFHFEGGGGAGQITNVTLDNVYNRGSKVTNTTGWTRTNATTPQFV